MRQKEIDRVRWLLNSWFTWEYLPFDLILEKVEDLRKYEYDLLWFNGD